MQFNVVYLKTQSGTQPYVAFLTPAFHSCFSVLEEFTWHWILVYCIRFGCVLWQVFLVGSRKQLIFLVLQSKC